MMTAIFFSAIPIRLFWRTDIFDDISDDLFFQVQTEVRRHLIVAAAARVEFFSGLADLLGKKASMFMWISSSASLNLIVPFSIPDRMTFNPFTIFTASADEMTFARLSR